MEAQEKKKKKEKETTASTSPSGVFRIIGWGLLMSFLASCAVAGLVLGIVALTESPNQVASSDVIIACNRTCTYCEANGSNVMPWGGRSEQQFSTNTLGVGPLFAALNPVNYTGGYNICSIGVGSGSDSGGVADPPASTAEHRHHHRRDKRFAGYGDDFSWRTQRVPPPGYSIASGDGALPASIEVDGSGFIIGNLTATCGAYIGCEMLAPVGNYTILYTYNTSGMVYFQVYPALELIRFELVNLTSVVYGLNSSALMQNITYLTVQVDLLWVTVDALTVVIDNHAAEIANISATLVQLINETNTTANYVYNVLNVTVSQLETNLTLVSAVANAALACCTSNNATIAGLIANVTALQMNMTTVDAEIAALQGNVTALQVQVTILQSNVTTMQSEIDVLQTNVTSLANTTSILQSNITSLANTTNTLEQEVAALSGCCNGTGNGTTTMTVGAIVAPATNGATIAGSVLHLAEADSTTPGIVYGWVDTGSQQTNVGYLTTPSTSAATASTAMGYAALSVSQATSNTAFGAFALPNSTSGAHTIAVGFNSGIGFVNGSYSIYLGANTQAGDPAASHEYVFGSSRGGVPLVGHGSDSYTLDIVAIPSASNPTLQIDATGRLTQTGSSMIYKNPLPDPNVTYFAPYIEQLVPRAFTFKSDPTNRTRMGYYAEEVEAILNPANESAFQSLLNYRPVDDTSQPMYAEQVWTPDPTTGLLVQQEQVVYPKKQVVDSINYQMFVVPIASYLKWIEQRSVALEQFTGLTPPTVTAAMATPTPTPSPTPMPPPP